MSHLSKKHDVKVLTFQHDKSLPKVETVDGCQVSRMPFLLRISKGFISVRSLNYFFKEVRLADRVILNLPNAEGLPLALMAKLFKIKLVVFFHCQISFEKGLVKKIISFLANLVIYAQLALADEIIAYTQDYVNSTLAGKLFKGKITYALPPVKKLEINKSLLKEMKQKKGNRLWIGYAGRVSAEKGLFFLAKAISLLKKSENVKLVIAGPYGKDVVGEEDYYTSLVELMEDLKIKYQFVGKLKGSSLGAYYQSLDLLVLPSTNSTEAFGMVQAEAMLLGIPVIASDLPGVRQPVRLTGMGKVVPIKDAQALASAIEDIVNNKQKYAAADKKKKAGEIFSEKHTLDAVERLLFL